jgi:hypothetical protein
MVPLKTWRKDLQNMRYKYSLYVVNKCNDIGCEQYSTERDIREVFDENPQCKGYSMRYNKPWCLKNKSSRTPENNHIFYQKIV